MNVVENQKVIKEIIDGTFKKLKDLYNTGSGDLHIIFPNYSSYAVSGIVDNIKKHRISEQELRFAFVEQFIQTPGARMWHYSVETPTHYKYTSARNGNEPNIKGKRSGKTDLTLYDNENKPVAFFEFKAGRLSPNDGKKEFNREFKYDVIKLVAESQYNDCLGYSLHLIEKNDDKIKDFDEYLKAAIENIEDAYPKEINVLPIYKIKEKIIYMSCELK